MLWCVVTMELGIVDVMLTPHSIGQGKKIILYKLITGETVLLNSLMFVCVQTSWESDRKGKETNLSRFLSTWTKLNSSMIESTVRS